MRRVTLSGVPVHLALGAAALRKQGFTHRALGGAALGDDVPFMPKLSS